MNKTEVFGKVYWYLFLAYTFGILFKTIDYKYNFNLITYCIVYLVCFFSLYGLVYLIDNSQQLNE
jgi:hypothetical protein